MFGVFKFRKSVKASVEAVVGLLAPASVSGKTFGSVPIALFGDAYVMGFLQVFIMHVAQAGRREAIRPEEQLAIFEACMTALAPAYAKQIVSMLLEINEPGHPLNVHYSVGRKEAAEYVSALASGRGDVVQSSLVSFTDFIKRNYGAAD